MSTCTCLAFVAQVGVTSLSTARSRRSFAVSQALLALISFTYYNHKFITNFIYKAANEAIVLINSEAT